jgi:hypothetical protein
MQRNKCFIRTTFGKLDGIVSRLHRERVLRPGGATRPPKPAIERPFGRDRSKRPEAHAPILSPFAPSSYRSSMLGPGYSPS